MATIRDLAKKVRDDAKKNRESSENKARQERLSNATLSSNTAFTSAAKPQAELSKPAKITSDVSGEAWTRATPSQTVIPEKTVQEKTTTDNKQGFLSRLTNTVKGGLKGSLATNTDAMGALYESGQNARDRQNQEYLADYKRSLDRAKRDLEAMQADNRLHPNTWSAGDLESQGYIVEDAQRKYDAMLKVVNGNVQQKAATASRDLSAAVQESSAKDIAKAKEGLGTAGQILVDAGASLTQMAGDAAVGVATGTSGTMLPFGLRALGGGTMQARQEGADIEDQMLYGSAIAAKEILTEKMFNIALPFSKAYGGGALDDVVQSSIGKAVDKFAKTDAGKKLLGGGLTLAASALSEGAEEFIGDWLEWQLPRIYGGDVASAGETLTNSMYDFLVGAASGLMGDVSGKVASGTANGVQSQIATRQVGQAVKDATGNTKNTSLISEIQKGLAADEGSKARTLAQQAQKELDSKKTVSNKTLGNLAVENRKDLKSILENADAAVAEAARAELAATGNVSTQTMAKLRASAKVSPAASAQVQQTEAQAQVTRAENPGSTVLDAATTLFTQQGMKLKTAQEKAGIVQKLIAGEEVSVRDINKLNPTSKESQAIFTQLTGVQFPEGKVTQEQLYTLYRSAHDVAAQAQTESVAIDSAEGREAFPGINRVLDKNGQATPVNQMSEEQILEQAKTVRETANPEADARAAQALAQMRGEIAPDGNALLSFKEFSDFIKQQNPKATREETARLYDQYLKDNQTVEFRGQRLSHQQFMDMVRDAPRGSELTEAEAESLWAAEVDRQRGARDEKYSVSEYQRTREAEMNTAAEQARRAENDATAKWMRDVLHPVGVQDVVVEYGTMAKNENAYIDGNGILHFNGDRMDGTNAMVWTLGHELFHHGENRTGNTGALTDATIQTFKKLNDAGALSGKAKTWMDDVDARLEKLTEVYQKHAKQVGDDPARIDGQYVKEELAADLMRLAFTDDNLMMKLAGEKPSLLIRAESAVNRLAAKLSGNEQLRAAVEARNALTDLEARFEKALKTTEAETVFHEPGAFTDEKGDLVVESDGNGSARFSLSTYEKSGKEILSIWLDKAVERNELSQEDADGIKASLDEIYKTCQSYKDNYAPFSAWSDAKVVTDAKGNPVFSVVKANGDYSMNLDFSLVCKKRRTLDAVLNEMVRRGMADNIDLGQENIVRVNDIIRSHGFETACALCFVDSKRFRQAQVADDFVKMYNDQVESLIPKDSGLKADYFNFGGNSLIENTGTGIDTLKDTELDFTKVDKILKEQEPKKGGGSIEYRIAKHLKENAQDRKLVTRGDFLSTRGFNVIKKENPKVLAIFATKKGAGGPKSAESDVQYLNEVLSSRTFEAEKAYEVGGVRIQSFSDFVPRMVFDYAQMFADMSAKKLPGHAYTKEPLFVEMFGLTGLKINMSLIPKVIDGGMAAGLDADGGYAWADESFDYSTALKIQSAEGYSKNCGTIAVGVSDEHIRKLLADPNIRMVIPYHKSGLNPTVAKMNRIDQFTDYTNYQSTRRADGVKLDPKKSADKKLLDQEVNFNQRLHELGETGDPRAVVEEYVRWCEDNNLLPKFDQFVYQKVGDMFVEENGHKVVDPNYYKLIEDFSVYDGDTYTPQQAVTMTFPTEDSAFGSMADLIKQGLEEDAILEGKRSEEVGPIVDEIAAAMGGKRFSIADTDLSFAEQVDLVSKNRLNEVLEPGTSYQYGLTDSALYVQKEPNPMMQELGYGDYALVVTQDHIRQMLGKREDRAGNVINEHNHQLTVDQVSRIPELLRSPAAVLVAKGRPESLVFVTTETDYRGRPIIIPVKANGTDLAYDGVEGPAHVVTSMYGRDDFGKFFSDAVNRGELVYYKKERIDPILTNAGYQSSGLLSGIDSDTIVGQVNPIVKNPGERKFSLDDQKMEAVESSDILTRYSVREEEPPKKVISNVYKAFYARDGKLYPPMVANMTDAEKKTALRGAVSGTMKSLDTPVGVWLNADIGKLALDADGNPVRNTKGRLAVVNEKGGGTLAFRPGWHLGEWPDAKQFNKDSKVYGKKSVMPDGLVFARCEIAADVDYQLDAMSLGMKENGKFDRTQAGLPMVPVNGYYKYRTNVDPTTAPWYITGAMRVVEILDDDDCAAICAKFGVKPSPRESGKKIDLAEYGLKRGPVTATADLNPYKKSEAIAQNESALQAALNDPAFADAYTSRALNFDDEEIQKEFARNRQNADEYREKAKDWKQLHVRSEKRYSITPEFEQWYLEGFADQDDRDRVKQEIEDLRTKYGTIPAGENPTREVNLPRKIDEKTRVHDTARTVMEAEATPEKRLADIQKAVLDGKLADVPVKNDVVSRRARARIEKNGWQTSLTDWTAKVRAGETSADLVAEGAVLLNNAGNSDLSGEQYVELLTDYSNLMHRTGQSLQAARILKTLSPEGRLYGIQKTVNQLNDSNRTKAEKKKGFDPAAWAEQNEIKLDPALVDAYRNAKTDTERDFLLGQIQQNIADQMPASLSEKLNNWRYLAMLGNFRTQIRNVLGNFFFQVPREVKETVAGGIEGALEKAGVKIDRTRSVVRDSATYKAAMKDFDSVRDVILSGGKVNEKMSYLNGIDSKRRIYKNKVLEGYRRVVNTAMDSGDAVFCKFTYADSLARFMAANHTTWDAAPETLREKGRLLAIKEAAEATYRDNNAFSEMVLSMRFKNPGNNKAKKAVNAVVEGILPFRKTPANILVRGVEYSPLGLVKTAVDTVSAAKGSRNVTGSDLVNEFAKSLTGSGLFALGYFLTKMGVLTALGPDDDDKEKEFWELQGNQSYSINLFGRSYTIDWLAPEAIPLLVGANTAEIAAEEGLDLNAVTKAATRITDPMLEMSMLQGVNSLIENISNTKTVAALPSLVLNSLWSYGLQYVPTLTGQLNRAMDNTRRTTYTDATSGVPTGVQYSLGKLSQKVPGWSYNQIPYIDQWGRMEENYESKLGNAFAQFLSPAYQSIPETSDMERELQRLYDATGETGVLPSKAPKYLTVDGERRDLTAEEYVNYATLRGQTAYDMLTDLTGSAVYRKMSDKDKVKAVGEIYSYAADLAKQDLLGGETKGTTQKAVNADSYGISSAEYAALKTHTAGIESLKYKDQTDDDGNLKTIQNSRGLQTMEAVYSAYPSLTKKQYEALFEALGVGKTIRGYSKQMVQNKLNQMRKQAAQ